MPKCSGSSARRSRRGRARGCPDRRGAGVDLGQTPAGAGEADAAGPRRIGLDRDEGPGKGPQSPLRNGQRPGRRRAALLARRAGRGLPAVGLVPLQQIRAAAQAGSLDRVDRGCGGGADRGGQRRAHLAGQPGIARGARAPRAQRLRRADRTGRAGMGAEQPEPDGTTARRLSAEAARLGMGLPQAAAIRCTGRHCNTRAPCIASRSAKAASIWRRPRKKVLSGSARQRPARSSGNGRLTRWTHPASNSARTTNGWSRGAGMPRSRSGTCRKCFRGTFRRLCLNSNTPTESGCGAWPSVRTVCAWRREAAGRRTRRAKSRSGTLPRVKSC